MRGEGAGLMPGNGDRNVGIFGGERREGIKTTVGVSASNSH